MALGSAFLGRGGGEEVEGVVLVGAEVVDDVGGGGRGDGVGLGGLGEGEGGGLWPRSSSNTFF